MQTLLLLQVYFSFSLATFVIQWPQNEVISLEMDKELYISKIISFCIRFKWRGPLQDEKRKIIFCSNQKNYGKLCFSLKLPLNQGFVGLNGKDLIFDIPKKKAQPLAWHHFCFSSDAKKYQVI